LNVRICRDERADLPMSGSSCDCRCQDVRVFEIHVVEVLAVSTPGVAIAGRVRAGTVRVGDRVTTVTDAAGGSWPVDLEVRYLHAVDGNPWPDDLGDLEDFFLNQKRSVSVDAMGPGQGGLITIFGPHDSVDRDQSLLG
jgi:hypothetical protein